MSEQVGAVERELLARARTRLHARGAEHYRLLEDVAELDRVGVADRTGDRLTERLVETLARCDRREANRLVEQARDLVPHAGIGGQPLPARLPHTSTALAAGEIGEAHLVIIQKTMRRIEELEHLTPAVVAEAEQSLADKARALPPAGLAHAAQRLLAHLDPDGAAPKPEEARADAVQLLRRRDGSLDMRASITEPAAAAMIDDGFEVMSRPAGPDDPRDLPARRAEAFKELFAAANSRHGLITDTRHEGSPTEPGDSEPGDSEPGESESGDSEPSDSEPSDSEPGDGQDALIPEPRRPEPRQPEPSQPAGAAAGSAGRALIAITIDHEWLRRAVGHGVLDNQQLVNAAAVRRLACDADIIPIVLGTRSETLDIGRRSRTVPDALRRALTVRDQGCAFPGCTRRPRRCQAHHVRFWGHGGPTEIDNLVLLCTHHHNQVHHAGWQVKMINRRPWFTPPPWIDPTQQPRPGGPAPPLPTAA
ncbi:HNH endonuclease signature motif containing protein [Actinomycetospora aeridis]|uniref:DUF222 domain-containing protein n=1 Tax=Actinomycetospora aeridis TaxID=3129231 RepID=A0ABU8N6C5_9PSEU